MNVQIWFVDTQRDFINEDGVLPVPNAPEILENLANLRDVATRFGVRCVYTQDLHAMDDAELSDNPDFKETFPPHCIGGTLGSMFVDEVGVYQFAGAKILDAKDDLAKIAMEVENLDDFLNRDIILTKQIFSTFDGNKNAETYLELTRPDVVFVCGVAGDVCVKAVIEGLLRMNRLLEDLDDKPMKIGIVTDAIKSLDEKNFQTFKMQTTLDNSEAHLVTTGFVNNFLAIVDGLGDTV